MKDEDKPVGLLENFREIKARARDPPETQSSAASRQELESLEKMRTAPKAEPRLTIGGGIEENVHKEIKRRLEHSIGTLRQKLDDAKDRAKKGFSLAKSRDRAKKDFDRPR